MISTITPTNDPTFLEETYQSLLRQTYPDWEWILVPNNGGKIPESIRRGKQVKVIELDICVENIGSLKRFACRQAKGDILFELDHDDVLMPTALEECAAAFEDPEVVLAYSNCVEFHHDTWQPHTFGLQYGWRYRPFSYQGHELQEAVAFEPTPHSLGKIYWAPNHFRAWRRSAYEEIGGHDPKMKVIDDHDLMCRLYLKGKLKHINEPLYLYRVHGKNAWLERNQAIQDTTHEVYAKYIYQLVEKWCDLNQYPKIDLGSVRGLKPENWQSADVREGADHRFDFKDPWPLADNSVGAFRAWDILEHVADKIHVLNEIHRCLVPGGWLLSGTPSALGNGAFMDPTHVSFWVDKSFWYCTSKQYRHFVPELTARFQAHRLETVFPSAWHREQNIPYVVADLVALKEGYDRPAQHIPGLVEI